jgi:hypothetical protein
MNDGAQRDESALGTGNKLHAFEFEITVNRTRVASLGRVGANEGKPQTLSDVWNLTCEDEDNTGEGSFGLRVLEKYGIVSWMAEKGGVAAEVIG